MSTQSIPVISQPFQGVSFQTDDFTSLNTTGTSTDFTFVNDGYTVLYLVTFLTGAETSDLTITSVPDNAARLGNIAQHFALADTGNVYQYGPFRPIWWNYGGVVRCSFANSAALAADEIQALAVRYTF